MHFEDGANAGGFSLPEKNALVINPSSGFKDFSSVFVHEARHAIQFHIFNDDSDLYRFSDGEKLKRAIEADATAHECAFIYQARKTNPEIYEEHSYLPMLHAYADTLERTGNERKAMQASFQSWYSYDYYRDYYDKSTLDRVEALVNYGISTGKLNRWLTAMTENTPPPLSATKRPIPLKYITQIKTRPPTFALFSSNPEKLPESYLRYLMRGMARDLKMEGVPIRVLMRKAKNPTYRKIRER